MQRCNASIGLLELVQYHLLAFHLTACLAHPLLQITHIAPSNTVTPEKMHITFT
jgi:hypothetical protein